MPAIKVTLGGTDYSVPKLNIGQLEEVTAAFDMLPVRRPFAILRIAMRRATPVIENWDEVEPGNDEVAAAVSAILANSGFQKADPSGPNPEAPKDGAAS